MKPQTPAIFPIQHFALSNRWSWENWEPVIHNGTSSSNLEVFAKFCLPYIELQPKIPDNIPNAKVEIDPCLLERAEIEAGFFNLFGDVQSQEAVRTFPWKLRRKFQNSIYVNIFDDEPRIYCKDKANISHDFCSGIAVSPSTYLRPIRFTDAACMSNDFVRVDFSESGWSFEWGPLAEILNAPSQNRSIQAQRMSSYVYFAGNSIYVRKSSDPTEYWFKLTNPRKTTSEDE